MNAPFVVAQVVTTGQGTGNPNPRVIKLEKPANNQAVTVHLDGATRLDLSDIGTANLTFVRVGDKLVILFDNQSTITIDPFYVNGVPLQDLSVEIEPGRVFSGTEFVGLVQISDDQ